MDIVDPLRGFPCVIRLTLTVLLSLTLLTRACNPVLAETNVLPFQFVGIFL